MKKGLIAVGLVGMLAAGAALAAGMHHGGMQKRLEARISAMEDLVQATPQQRQVIDQAKQNILAAFQQQKGLGNVHGQFMDAFTSDNFDVNQMNSVVDQRADQVRQLGHTVVANLKTVHDALTPEQRKTLAQHVQEQRAKWQQKRQQQGGFGGQEQQ